MIINNISALLAFFYLKTLFIKHVRKENAPWIWNPLTPIMRQSWTSHYQLMNRSRALTVVAYTVILFPSHDYRKLVLINFRLVISKMGTHWSTVWSTTAFPIHLMETNESNHWAHAFASIGRKWIYQFTQFLPISDNGY